MIRHVPVLTRELLSYLSPQPGENFIDGTFGQGGHAEKVLEATKQEDNLQKGGTLIAFEWDKELYLKAKKRFFRYGSRIILINDNFRNLKAKLSSEKINLPIKGIYFDLGACLWHYKESQRGFSFRRPEKLDMRFSCFSVRSAADILNSFSQKQLEEILERYGEVGSAAKIAKLVIEQRKKLKISDTRSLIKLLNHALPSPSHKARENLRRKAFQALRIAVNEELENLDLALHQAAEILQEQGLLAVISYHSLEDRIVKQFFKNDFRFQILTKTPIRPGLMERRFNPSSKSAKLRVAKKKHVTT